MGPSYKGRVKFGSEEPIDGRLLHAPSRSHPYANIYVRKCKGSPYRITVLELIRFLVGHVQVI